MAVLISLLLSSFFTCGVSAYDDIMNDTFTAWNAFRDPRNGLWCDTIYFSNDTLSDVCGSATNDWYSSAGTGMGLITEAVMAELGFLDRQTASDRALQTLNTIWTSWPRENFHGFYVHWTTSVFDVNSEFSTIDSAEMTLGALFAGNYFGGQVQVMANRIFMNVSWPDSIKAYDEPTIYPVVDQTTGVFSGDIRPYNEYYLVAYLAKIFDPTSPKAQIYFDTYFGTFGAPPGDGTYPVHLLYQGYDLLTDNPTRFMSSFIPQFCFYQSRGFQENAYYNQTMLPNWLQADMAFWASSLDASSRIWGQPVEGRVFGCGAGPGPTGYQVEAIDNSDLLVMSGAIMAGFLPTAGQISTSLRDEINADIRYLYDNDICTYGLVLSDGSKPKVIWRCSVVQEWWRAESFDTIDFSTSVLGYASNFLPADFYATYAF